MSQSHRNLTIDGANTDLVERFTRGLPLTEADPATFYAGGAKGTVPVTALSHFRLCLTFGGDGAWCQPSRMRWRSRVNPARPHICRLIIFVLVFTPSVRPL